MVGIIAPVIVGLVVGIGLVLVFSIFLQRSFILDTPPAIVIPKGIDSSIMPDDFAVLYSRDRVSTPVLDTKNNLHTRDMVCDPDIQVQVTLSDQELERLWQTVVQNDFFTMPEDLTTKCEYYGEGCILATPSFTSILNITAYGQSHAVKFNTAETPVNDKHVTDYRNIQSVIQSTIANQEEIKELPTPRCGYL